MHPPRLRYCGQEPNVATRVQVRALAAVDLVFQGMYLCRENETSLSLVDKRLSGFISIS